MVILPIQMDIQTPTLILTPTLTINLTLPNPNPNNPNHKSKMTKTPLLDETNNKSTIWPIT